MRLPGMWRKRRWWEKPMRFSKPIACLLVCLWMPAQAAHIGTIGPIYPIGEESALTLIMKNLREKEKSGELKKIQDAAIRRSMESMTHMPPVAGIGTVAQRTTKRIDPTVTYTQALTTDNGQIVIPAGTKINPLDVMHLSKRLVFFDGRDLQQREAVRRLVAHDQTKVKPILIAGSWLEMTKAWKTQVYYDQHGTLTKRFGIRAVPSVIYQQGNQLVLDEIPAKELR